MSAVAPIHAGETVASPRLERLRQDLLAADYSVCTVKARLLTESLREQSPVSKGRRGLGRLLYSAYSKALEKQAGGAAASDLVFRANRQLQRLATRFHNQQDWSVALARGFRHVLLNAPLEVYEQELLVGNASSHRVGAPLHPDYSGLLMDGELEGLSGRSDNPIAISQAEIRALREDVFPFWMTRSVLTKTPVQLADSGLAKTMAEGHEFILTQIAGISHLTPDYPTVLKTGLRGVERTIIDKIAESRDSVPFLEAALETVRAAIEHARRWQCHLSQLAQSETEPERARELSQLAAIVGRVPEYPAETFHEALQSIVLTHAMLHQESFQHGISFGRMDQYLSPYFENDLSNGSLSYSGAVELIGCFLGKAAELLPLFFDRATEYFSGLSSASGITLGGRKENGEDAVNRLSFAFLDAYDRMRLRQPNIHVRVHPEIDDDFMTRCCELLKQGGGIPALFNDEAIEPALLKAGLGQAEARAYSVVGCAEWGVPHCSFPAAGAGFVNLPAALLAALSGEPTSTDALLKALESRLEAVVSKAARGNNAIEATHVDTRPTPFLSAVVGGCIEKGKDVTAGGAKQNSSGLQGVGLADTVDSIAAIEAVIFGGQRWSMSELVAALECDFVGYELLQKELGAASKYGQGGRADAIAGVVAGIFRDTVANQTNGRGGRYRAGFWTMTTHQGFGRGTGALPSGRRSGLPFANGAAPQTTHTTGGPTAVLNACAQLQGMPNGVVVNQTINPRHVAGEAGNHLIMGLVRGYFSQGGMQVQFNVMDAALLEDARANPEKYPDLVVRISGYSAYFNDLTDAMKDELIARTRQGCA